MVSKGMVDQQGVTSITIPVVGMTCAACVSHVGEALESLPQIERAVVNLATEKATIHIPNGDMEKEDVRSAIENAGYKVGTESITLSIEGMTCAACVSQIETSISELDGVEEAFVNLASETAKIKYVPGLESISSIRRAISSAGYSSSYVDKEEFGYASTERAQRLIIQQAIVSLLGAGFIMFAMIPNVVSLIPFDYQYLAFIIASIIQFWAGSQFYTSAWNAAKHRTTNMNTLIAVGTSTAYLYSAFVAISDFLGINDSFNETHFGTSCAIIGMVLFGRYLESKSRRRATDSIKSLIEMAPKMATIIQDTELKTIPVDDLVIGNVVVVKPGEVIPVDGSIIEGFSEVDESSLTGESIPSVKKIGDSVFTSTVNGTGNIKIVAEALSENTVYSKIISLIEDTQASKAPIQRIADKLAALLVPIIICVSSLTFFIWMLFGPAPEHSYAIMAAVAVLVIACPCAMGLATPIAIMVGSGKGAENGILYRDALAIETLQTIEVVIFDKTGTLTNGEPKVSYINPSSDFKESEILKYAGSVEKNSEHVLARAIVSECASKNIEPYDIDQFQVFPGLGASATTDKKEILVGNKLFLETRGVEVSQNPNPGRFGEIHVSVEGEYAGSILVSDTIRDDAKETINRLQSMHLDLVLLSGDAKEVVETVADELSIRDHRSNFLPQDKAEYISKLQENGKKVCMVGDGINDAPALTQADLSIAMGNGTDVAIESAQITILGNRLSSVAKSIQLSKSCIKTIKQNLFWAFAYNILLVPVAAGILYPLFALQAVPEFLSPLIGDRGFLNPVVAAAAMGISSITVVLNALRLKNSNL
ncbi:MAG: heavy metal translocating P-type ATPase [Chloroflexi bacterium]|nr:heavy metal translocating P-type ATPase [Chloroflexota bacterium]|tara:strand:+ start:5722 stop:8190 length:2469 start_codon:yes stop_codon:yes gene_type:complete